MPVFDFVDYKDYLKNSLERGKQKRFAEFLRCQPAFLSQVLRGKPHLSLEQGMLATDYFRLTEQEREYFMASLQLARAGSVRLRNFFLARMEQIKASSARVASKIGSHEMLSDQAKARFYSSWKYALIHVLLTIPSDRPVEFLQERTGLSGKEISSVLEFLHEAGLISGKSGKLSPTKKRIHLNAEDELVGTHHKNFRMLAVRELDDPKGGALHFSSAMTLSRADAERVKSVILETISQTESILRPSPEETVRVLNIDLFEPGN
jgi:uncharacterized protein (TIGR02147 family)